MDKRKSLLIILFMMGLIVFDAFQQRYYINTFELSPEPALLGQLLKSHLIRWSVWGVVSIPYGLLVWSLFKKSEYLRFGGSLVVAVGSITSVTISVLLISLIFLLVQNVEITGTSFVEFFVFFSFQKGLTFFMAYITVAILLSNYFQSTRMKEQEFEIVDLKKNSEKLLKNLLPRDEQKEPYLSIKTGNKVTPIKLSDVIWIQADDYCVRIHTEERSFTLRKSLKALELQLSPFRFIRIHRGALLNLDYVDQINFESSTIRLQDDSELPLSRSGIKTLKKRIKEISL